ncbi:YdcF family protein [Gluconacetobacter entanii]|uniref:YdcF family protein n=1 Tax=Gluconacetobacter entanii TaxID=108528 RepID=A0ABT3K6P4_9PROT|nr:YdcF family protein [Gluconacetobacter entanii]MCW4591092.1 YdcF family protein [Gluconacetobacter entanii]MCW4594518.1 YdcF family protein [Gluconacetobacter entanii]NPC88706.1 YdcF family protein [Gluconacetobacter entanii]
MAAPAAMKAPARRGVLLLVLAVACMLVASWAMGLVWFVRDARRPPRMPPPCDGAVALTGGQGRIEASLQLMAQHRARQLLISGVDPHATLGDFLTRTPRLLPLGVWLHTTLGRQATSTLGNADETAQWVRTHGIHSLIVVTAGYHIRRAMMEIARAVPGVTLYPFAVQPPALVHPRRLATWRLLVVEYDKWLLACVDTARWTRPVHGLIHHDDTRPVAHAATP